MMGQDKLFQKKRELKRKQNIRERREIILIVCEGQKTEPNYFQEFPVPSAVVEIVGKGANTKSLVEHAEDLNRKDSYDQVWCVFDKDNFSKQNFNNAIKKAKDKGFRVAYSNECFELWYVLHFEYLESGIGRQQYFKKLTKQLGKKYEKKSISMYNKLLPLQKEAIKNARKLLSKYDNLSKAADNEPSTTVHFLVEELNKYSR